MPLPTLCERLQFDADQRANWWPSVARDPAYSIVEKFDIVNSSIRAEPLGECRMTPLVPYDIYGFQRYGSDLFVHFEIWELLESHRLPDNYAMMVSRRDLAIVNSHIHRFTLTREVKHCDWRRVPLDDKPYTFDLVLQQLPRGSRVEPTPRETIMAGGSAF